VPLRELSTEDLRLLIGQRIGLARLLPLALARLSDDPFASGDYHEGDLLKNVLDVPDRFWAQHPDWHREATGVATGALARLQDGTRDGGAAPVVREALERFLRT
jgi:hypothetical protein